MDTSLEEAAAFLDEVAELQTAVEQLTAKRAEQKLSIEKKLRRMKGLDETHENVVRVYKISLKDQKSPIETDRMEQIARKWAMEDLQEMSCALGVQDGQIDAELASIRAREDHLFSQSEEVAARAEHLIGWRKVMKTLLEPTKAQ